MAEVLYGTLTGTNNQSYSGFQNPITCLLIIIAQEGASLDTLLRFGFGIADGNAQWAASIFGDSTGRDTEKFTTRCIVAKSRPSGSIIKTLEASWVSFDNNGGPGNYGFTLNQQTNTESFQALTVSL